MEAKYPIKIWDQRGEEIVDLIVADDFSSKFFFRGVWFIHDRRFEFKPSEDTDPKLLDRFHVNSEGYLSVSRVIPLGLPRSAYWNEKTQVGIEVNALLDLVDDKPPEQFPKLWEPFLSFSDDQIRVMLGRVKDRTAGMALRYIGYPRLKEFLPELLEFVQDINWPASGEIAKLFVAIGEPALSLVKSVLNGDDEMWNEWILGCIVHFWPKELQLKLIPEIRRFLSLYPDREYLANYLKDLLSSEEEAGQETDPSK